MAKTTKLLGTDISDTHIIWAIAIVFILYLLWRYSGRIGLASESLSNGSPGGHPGGHRNHHHTGADSLGENKQYLGGQVSNADSIGLGGKQLSQQQVWAGATGGENVSASNLDVFSRSNAAQYKGGSSKRPVSSCSASQPLSAQELLPSGQAGDLSNVNFLKAGYHVGINTVGTSLRNANLQVRSEPPNPQSQVSPWLNSTISPDLMRVPLEIGCGSQ